MLFALVSSLLQLSVTYGIKQNVLTGSSLRCFINCSLTQNCEQVTKTNKSPGKWFCDFKTGKHIWTKRKNIFVESYVQISTDVYQRNALLEGMQTDVDDDSTLAAGEGSGGPPSEESEDRRVTTPKPFPDTSASKKNGILRGEILKSFIIFLC